MKHTLPDLPYAFEALEPVISAEILFLHHNKHHAAYVANLNSALERYAEAERRGDISAMIALQPAIRFNGGGHINHSIFWSNLAPKNSGGGEMPKGRLIEEIDRTWGSFERFVEIFGARAVAIQGSGWAWLGYHKESGRLDIACCANQDPLTLTGMTPLLGIDVWEHAYYLQYKNARAEYVKAIWQIINWHNVQERFLAAL